MIYNIDCEDCGTATTASRSDARRCASCRIRRQLAYAHKRSARPRACKECGRKHLPCHSNDTVHCASCLVQYRTYHEGHCAFCDTAAPLLHPTVPLCLNCAKSADSSLRSRVLRSLNAGWRRRREASSSS